jgi:23S rRNA pseudouridine2605 synthase
MQAPPETAYRSRIRGRRTIQEIAAMAGKTGLARALSKMGHCSRSEGAALVKEGRVRLNGQVKRDPETPVRLGVDKITVDAAAVRKAEHVYLMLNKPRGLVTTRTDELGRDTVYSCLTDGNLPHISPVGRLDKASEGLLLFTNDNAWANSITDPVTHLDKTYHVQIGALADEALLDLLKKGVIEEGEPLKVKQASIIRHGEKNSWVEITLDEGKNRHIRRLLEEFDIEVIRLMRISIGTLTLGPLAKGQWRMLTREEVRKLKS